MSLLSAAKSQNTSIKNSNTLMLDEKSLLFKVRNFEGCQPYTPIWKEMLQYTDIRTKSDDDKLWLLEHTPVFTQGKAGAKEHLLNPGAIPIVYTDRGGQITYHGPGQLIAYILFDIRRMKFTVRDIVTCLEKTVIELLKSYDIASYSKSDAPGVYIKKSKIASLGLRVRKGCTFHGIALNVDMDMEPFSRINPCGFTGLQMTQIKDFFPQVNLADISRQLAYCLHKQLISMQ